MTETLQRPSPSSTRYRRPADAPARRTPVAGALAALGAGGLGLVVVALAVLLVWAAEERTGASAVEALRAVLQVWLAAHGTVLDVPDGRLALTPLGLVALPLWLLWRAGRSVSRESRATSVRGACVAALAVAVPYAALVAGLAAAVQSGDVRPSLLSAAGNGLGVALTGAVAGALRPDRLWRAAWLRLGERARRVLPAVAAASGVLAAGGALLAGGSLAAHGSRAAELAGAADPGPVGGAALLLLGVSLVPNAVVWGVAWLAGPGFAVGIGTVVGPFAHDLGPVPSLPLLAALPGGGLPGWAGALALLVPLGAGAVAGGLLAGPRETAVVTRRALADTGLAAVTCGLLWALLAWLAGGAAGGARLSAVGPSPWQAGAALAAEVAVGALAAVLLLRRRRSR